MAEAVESKHRTIRTAQELADGKKLDISDKMRRFLKAVHADNAYWLWVNERLSDRFIWASEAFAAGLSRPEVGALADHLESAGLLSVEFDDLKAYPAVIADALQLKVDQLSKALRAVQKAVEEETACVLKFTDDGPIATAYPHGVPLVCYFTKEGACLVAYVESIGENRVYRRAVDIPVDEEHVLRRVASALEGKARLAEQAIKIHSTLLRLEDRLSNLRRFGRVVIV